MALPFGIQSHGVETMAGSSSRSLAAAALALLALPLLAETGRRWQSLLDNSPFAPPSTGQRKIETPATPLELHGVVVEDGVRWFTFFDPATKTWTTVREREEGELYFVRTYDDLRETATVEVKGSRVSVTLKRATIQSYPPGHSSRPAAAVAQGPGAAAPPAALTMAVTHPEEARRIARVTAEIEQRRDERRRLSKQPG